MSAAAVVPIIMSRLHGVMAMGAVGGSNDHALAISRTLARLPEAVAAGHVSPGAAALVMQKVAQ